MVWYLWLYLRGPGYCARCRVRRQVLWFRLEAKIIPSTCCTSLMQSLPQLWAPNCNSVVQAIWIVGTYLNCICKFNGFFPTDLVPGWRAILCWSICWGYTQSRKVPSSWFTVQFTRIFWNMELSCQFPHESFKSVYHMVTACIRLYWDQYQCRSSSQEILLSSSQVLNISKLLSFSAPVWNQMHWQ
jgi:hypothetical protein